MLQGGGIMPQKGHLGTEHRSKFLFCIPLEIDRDRNGLQMVQNAPKPHFWVILTHICLYLVGAPRSFEPFRTHNTAKRGQNGPNLGQKGLSQVIYAACKCWQSAFMHFASARQRFFFDFFSKCRAGGRLSSS